MLGSRPRRRGASRSSGSAAPGRRASVSSWSRRRRTVSSSTTTWPTRTATSSRSRTGTRSAAARARRILGFWNHARMGVYRDALAALADLAGRHIDPGAGTREIRLRAERGAGDRPARWRVPPRRLERREDGGMGVHRGRADPHAGREPRRSALEAAGRRVRRRRRVERRERGPPRLSRRRGPRLHARRRRPQRRRRKRRRRLLPLAPLRFFAISAEFERFTNLAFNRDRGPVSVWGLRLHANF